MVSQQVTIIRAVRNYIYIFSKNDYSKGLYGYSAFFYHR